MDLTQDIVAQIQTAIAEHRTVNIIGGNSKAFYGRPPEGLPLSLAKHQGVVEYQPEELVLTALAGTPLAEIEEILADQNQFLPFDPPQFGGGTLGGAVAAGLSGPRRPFTGAVRDFMLGVKMVTGRGEALSFGGQVMKNVAGFDLSRLLAGSLGTLGVLLEVSLKVLPAPTAEITLRQEIPAARALAAMTELMGQCLPLSGLAYLEPFLYLRLSGTESATAEAAKNLGGELLTEQVSFWTNLRDQQLPFFTEGQSNLWRLSVAPASHLPEIAGEWLLDWAGAQRWLRTTEPARRVFAAASDVGGHATLFRTRGSRTQVFQPLPPALERLHRTLKEAFDPHRIFNPGRMYEGL